jgi:hypothetical protein
MREGRMPKTAQEIVDMSQAEVDELFRSSPAGPIPSGEGEGTVIFHPGTKLADVAEKVAHQIAWQGKVFDPDKGELRNLVTPAHLNAIKAKVYKDESWFDGQEAIILDYSETSVVAHWIRDEMRLVGDGLYLGVVYWDHDRLLNFALQFPNGASPG